MKTFPPCLLYFQSDRYYKEAAEKERKKKELWTVGLEGLCLLSYDTWTILTGNTSLNTYTNISRVVSWTPHKHTSSFISSSLFLVHGMYKNV